MPTAAFASPRRRGRGARSGPTVSFAPAPGEDERRTNQRFKEWLVNLVITHVTARLADLEGSSSSAALGTDGRRRRDAAAARAILAAHDQFATKKGALLDALEDAFPFIQNALVASVSAVAVADAATYGAGMSTEGDGGVKGKKTRAKRKRAQRATEEAKDGGEIKSSKRRRQGTDKHAVGRLEEAEERSDDEAEQGEEECGTDHASAERKKKAAVGKKKAGGRWLERRVEQCRAFKEEHGHLNIPPKHPVLGSFSLWLKKKHSKQLKGDHISSGAAQLLQAVEELGFDFAPKTKAVPFEDRAEQLKQYREENGHMYIPLEHPELGKWADELRRKKRHWEKIERDGKGYSGKKLSQKAIEQLQAYDDLGFVWKRRIRQNRKYENFDERFAELVAYKEVYGNTRVPTESRQNPSNEHAALGKWVAFVRSQYSKLSQGSPQSYLTPERMARLTEVGFMFRVQQRITSWEERLEQLKEYKQRHGHLKVPLNHPTLGRSFTEVFRQYHKHNLQGKKTPLTPEKQKQLDDLGFVWQVGKRRLEGQVHAAEKTYTFEERFEQFKRFRARHGHPYVPQTDTTRVGEPSEEVGLGRWVAKQRQRYRYMKMGQKKGGYGSALTTEQALKLADAGFAWEASRVRREPRDDTGAEENGF